MGKRKYDSPPWLFKGRAIYQLQLVKLEEAQKYIPKDLAIISLCGNLPGRTKLGAAFMHSYTLGGFYLARYADSPAGTFDECVALAGLVWDKPWSCAWAARVFVNNREARDHGRKHVGLPSRICTLTRSQHRSKHTWWDQPLQGQSSQPVKVDSIPEGSADASFESASDTVTLRNVERSSSWLPWRKSGGSEGLNSPVCTFSNFPSGYGKRGPKIKMKLPSFSGRTPETPSMLQYTCLLSTRVRPIQPLALSLPFREEQGKPESPELLNGVLAGKPVIALAFDDMDMLVYEPTPVPEKLILDDNRELQKSTPQLLPVA